jgi:hypothetical protein
MFDSVARGNSMQVTVAEDLAVGIGDQTARLSPGEAFRLAEKLIRRATVRMITEEAQLGSRTPSRAVREPRRQ